MPHGQRVTIEAEIVMDGLTSDEWKAIRRLAGVTCVVNGGSKRFPCQGCVDAARDYFHKQTGK